MLEALVTGDEKTVLADRSYDYPQSMKCWKIGDSGCRRPVNPAYVRRDEIAILRGSPAKLAEATGFAPRYRFEDTLAWMLQEGIHQ